MFRQNEPISDCDFLDMFDEFDKDHSGTLTWEELKEGLLGRGVPIESIEVLLNLSSFLKYIIFCLVK